MLLYGKNQRFEKSYIYIAGPKKEVRGGAVWEKLEIQKIIHIYSGTEKGGQGGAVWEKLRFQEILHIYIEIINQAIPAYLDAGGKEKT